jgi:hypothetical protein
MVAPVKTGHSLSGYLEGVGAGRRTCRLGRLGTSACGWRQTVRVWKAEAGWRWRVFALGV